MDKLIEGVQQFRQSLLPKFAGLFRELAEGQHPPVLFITCCDSRIDPCLITQTQPGDMMVVRNPGNIVPPGHMASGEGAAIELCVTKLQVKHIVVCGHSDCSAMKCLLWPEKAAGMKKIGPWVFYAEPARRRVLAERRGLPHDELVTAVTRENVVHQLANVRGFPCVAEAVAQGRLELHGWYYDIATGEILSLDAETGAFKAL